MKCQIGSKLYCLLLVGLMLLAVPRTGDAQQHVFAPVGPTGSLGTTWEGQFQFSPFILGNAPTGTWTSAFVAIDWTGSTTGQWSSEAQTALHSQAWDPFFNPPGNGAAPANSGTVYWSAATAATGSGNTTGATNNIYWSVANLNNPIVSNGSQTVYLSSRQNWVGTGGASATHANVRVVLNPNIVTGLLGNGLGIPSAYTDLGTFAVGSTSHDVAINNTETGDAGFTWLRFQVDRDVTANDAFDMFTSDAPGGTPQDPRVSLFRNTANGLFAVASTDDMPGTLHSGLTFGSADTAEFGRDGYGAPGTAGFFNGRGGTLAIPDLNPYGYYSGTAGAARLFAGEEYYVAISHWSGTNPFAEQGDLVITADQVILGGVNMGMNGPATALGNGNVLFSFRSVPEPGSFAILALGGIAMMVGRRRRS